LTLSCAASQKSSAVASTRRRRLMPAVLARMLAHARPTPHRYARPAALQPVRHPRTDAAQDPTAAAQMAAATRSYPCRTRGGAAGGLRCRYPVRQTPRAGVSSRLVLPRSQRSKGIEWRWCAAAAGLLRGTAPPGRRRTRSGRARAMREPYRIARPGWSWYAGTGLSPDTPASAPGRCRFEGVLLGLAVARQDEAAWAPADRLARQQDPLVLTRK
jgi:hypothetical protein